MIGMTNFVIVVTVFGTLLIVITLYIAFQQEKGIKCLKEISKDMKTHMPQPHEEHRTHHKETIGILKSIKEDTAKIAETK